MPLLGKIAVKDAFFAKLYLCKSIQFIHKDAIKNKKHMKAELGEPYVQNLPKLWNEIKASQGNLKELYLNMKLEI